MIEPTETVLVIPDTQIPFDHQDSIKFLKAVEKRCKPTRYVQIGDLTDSHALSNFVTDPDGWSAGNELGATVKRLEDYYKAFPTMDVIIGNHDERLYNKAFDAGIPRSCIKNLDEILEFPIGWELHDEIIIDDVGYEHGNDLGGAARAPKNAIDVNMRSTVFGHHHATAGISWFANKKFLLFGFNVGCLMNTKSYAAKYGKKFVKKPILGCGVIQEGIPIFIPMLLDSKGRWIGRL